MFWNHLEDESLRETVKEVVNKLDDTSDYRPNYKKSPNILSPDIDTQTFIGDIMHSNTYLTQRIPANWDDAE